MDVSSPLPLRWRVVWVACIRGITHAHTLTRLHSNITVLSYTYKQPASTQQVTYYNPPPCILKLGNPGIHRSPLKSLVCCLSPCITQNSDVPFIEWLLLLGEKRAPGKESHYKQARDLWNQSPAQSVPLIVYACCETDTTTHLMQKKNSLQVKQRARKKEKTCV